VPASHGTCRVTEKGGDHVTAGEGKHNPLHSCRAIPRFNYLQLSNNHLVMKAPSCIIFKQLKVITHSCYVLIIQMVECRNAVIVCDLGVASPHFKSSSKVFFATDEQQLDYYFPKLCHISCKLGGCHA